MRKLKFFPASIVLGLSSLVWLALTIPALWHAHVLANLEPYPDGLFYVGQAWSWVHGHGWQLSYRGETVTTTVPPLYSLSFIPVFLIWTNVKAFYLTNVLVGLGSLVVFLATVSRLTKRLWLVAAAAILYGLHAYIVWLPTLPMAENVGLFLTCLGLWLLLTPKLTSRLVMTLGVVAGCLVLTKYAYVSLAVMFLALAFGRVVVARQWGLAKGMILSGGLACLMVLGWFGRQQENPFRMFLPSHFSQPSASGITFYSLTYLAANLRFYVTTLLGQSTRFLWQTEPLTSLLIPMMSVLGALVLFWKHQKIDRSVGLVVALLAGLVPVFLLFYVADARYVIMAIPMMVLGLIMVGESLATTHPRWLSPALVGITIICLAVSQKTLWRQVIASNVLGRSQAWQYEAIIQLNDYFAQHDPGIVATVLPPVLVEMYQTSAYRVMPLAEGQLFVGQQLWGDDITYSDITGTMKRFQAQGVPVYLTNAYLGHDPVITDSYHRLQTNLKWELVHEGCLGTCNLYRLVN